ncbi:hypothetical protein A7985_13160 [Pseudoalteromonas luteoviolacea]|uniref:Uncharacterized protein n=1 Tax=Pseudoalteromonas luteoviolacea TaxID=43657 RepID=A0A1C0TPQ5_9GAMM|nr:hypothetical protein [Pseudoalteromonas luteoviolacea]OCQ20750.1 hypothetical protein A7985_13160 [Pseudoalteromonas luteoviolacea]
MHPIQAQLLGVTPLKLKAQYSKDSDVDDAHQIDLSPAPLVLSEQLQNDILRATLQDALEVVQGEHIIFTGNSLQLPEAKLNAEQKKQLWRVICDANSK